MTRLPALGPRGEGWVLIQIVLLVLVATAGWAFGPDWSGPLRFAGIIAGILLIAGGVLLGVRAVADLGSALNPLPRPGDQAGEGTPVILVLGALNTGKSGGKLAKLLASKFTVVSYDRRGRGKSADTAPYSPPRETEDIAALVARLADRSACMAIPQALPSRSGPR